MSLPSTADYATPWTADDVIIECEAIDPEAGDPQDWPSWTDADRYEPSPDDVAWHAEQVEDWAAYEAWSQRLEQIYEACETMDRLEMMCGNPITDQDVATGGSAIG